MARISESNLWKIIFGFLIFRTLSNRLKRIIRCHRFAINRGNHRLLWTTFAKRQRLHFKFWIDSSGSVDSSRSYKFTCSDKIVLSKGGSVTFQFENFKVTAKKQRNRFVYSAWTCQKRSCWTWCSPDRCRWCGSLLGPRNAAFLADRFCSQLGNRRMVQDSNFKLSLNRETSWR